MPTTPNPWRVTPIPYVETVDGGSVTVYTICGPNLTGEPVVLAHVYDREDNARLMAEAHELVASLRETLRALEQHLDDDTAHAGLSHRDHCCPCNQNEVARAKALLARIDRGE
jgi:hypothetical protein